MYCGKHLILNLQEYASAALNAWEKIESGDQKIGREKKLLWNRRKNASASMLTVRTYCDLLGPDCDAQSGLTEEFKSIVDASHLVAFRGNRFNVPFHNAGAVFYHGDDFHALCASLDTCREENMYIKCLKADFELDIILAGIRAMGIIGQHIIPLNPILTGLFESKFLLGGGQFDPPFRSRPRRGRSPRNFAWMSRHM